MFTGIIETTGELIELWAEQSNWHFKIKSSISGDLKIDQSVAHNGVCLTVVDCTSDWHVVTAIAETMKRTTLGSWTLGQAINLERCTVLNGRLDGHLVQGHVDTIGVCKSIENQDGSFLYHIDYQSEKDDYITVEKGSICINGVSLTVVDSAPQSFSVALIPYTIEHTNFAQLKPNDPVNLEFDIIGKYLVALSKKRTT